MIHVMKKNSDIAMHGIGQQLMAMGNSIGNTYASQYGMYVCI